jgi:hypothetical protein
MNHSKGVAASQALVRLAVTGVTAAICAAAALGAWVSLALGSLAMPGLQPSYARQRRGRAG